MGGECIQPPQQSLEGQTISVEASRFVGLCCLCHCVVDYFCHLFVALRVVVDYG